jgi:phage-related protein
MSIGFTATNVTTQIIPDRSLLASNTSSVRTAKFGDGYEQRTVTGINSLSQEYSISFINRSKEVVDDISAFFETKKGITAFNFTIPDTNSTSVTTGTTSSNSGDEVTLTAVNLDISPEAVVTKPNGSAAGTVTSIAGAVVTISQLDYPGDNIILTFTNQNEKTFKVVCTDWDVLYDSKNFYSINTTFRRVYEA